jgi:type IV secretory pathway TraG/TraD family ATPase VirD4
LIEDAEPEAQAQMNIFLQSAESEKTASSIKTVLATGLQMFTDNMVKRITSLNEINPKSLRNILRTFI